MQIKANAVASSTLCFLACSGRPVSIGRLPSGVQVFTETSGPPMSSTARGDEHRAAFAAEFDGRFTDAKVVESPENQGEALRPGASSWLSFDEPSLIELTPTQRVPRLAVQRTPFSASML